MVTRSFRWLLAALLVWITFLALKPARPDAPMLIWDKAAHALAFAMLAIVAGLASPSHWLARSRALMLRIALALLAYGLLIEMMQALTPTRAAEVQDLIADCVGIAAGLLIWSMARWLSVRPPGP